MRRPSYGRHSSGQARVTNEGKNFYLASNNTTRPDNTEQSRHEYDCPTTVNVASGRSVTFGKPVDDLTDSELMANYLRFAKKNCGESELVVASGANSDADIVHRDWLFIDDDPVRVDDNGTRLCRTKYAATGNEADRKKASIPVPRVPMRASYAIK